MSDQSNGDTRRPKSDSEKYSLPVHPYFIRHPRVGWSLIALFVIGGVAVSAIVFAMAESSPISASDRYLVNVTNRTGDEITFAYSLAWDVGPEGTLMPAERFDSASHRVTLDTCPVELVDPDEPGNHSTFPYADVMVDGERIITYCTNDDRLESGESRIFRARWDDLDGNRPKESALHRLWGKPPGRDRVIDIFWSDLVSADFSIAFTDATPFE